MNISEEKLEQQLRALFADERLDLPPPLDATKSIVEGAQRRRRRRRSMAATTSVVAAALVVSGGLAVFKIQSQESVAVMSGGPPELSVRPPDNLTPGASQPPVGSAPANTGQLDSQPPTSGIKPPKSTAHPSTAEKSPVTTGPLLAADGFGTLKLGMTEAEVAAQGVTLTSKQSGATCNLYDVTGGGLPAAASVAISAANGLVIVTPAAAAHTPEGIGAGSTRDDIVAAYPGATDGAGSSVVAPARSISEYHFTLDAKGVVNQTALYSTSQDCVG